MTLIRRSPSSTSISVSALAVRSSASSRTSAGSMRIAPLSPEPAGVLRLSHVIPVSLSAQRSVRRPRLASTLNATWRGAAAAPIVRRTMSLDGSLGIRVNGEHRRVPGGISVAEMLSELGLDPLSVAVERNLEIVPRSSLGEVCVEDGDDFRDRAFRRRRLSDGAAKHPGGQVDRRGPHASPRG